jgi:hypothetical protein
VKLVKATPFAKNIILLVHDLEEVIQGWDRKPNADNNVLYILQGHSANTDNVNNN